MHPTIGVPLLGLMLFEVSRTVNATCAAGVVLIVIAAVAAKKDVAQARGLDKIVALANLCFAAPLGVFGAEHFAAAQGISTIVPKFVPWPLFWTYFVGVCLIAASLSIATKLQVRWSGLMWGIMMFLFVAMMDLPGALQDSRNRISWALLAREMSFGAGGWCLAAGVPDGWSAPVRRALFTLGRIIIGVAAIFYGVEHFFHPHNVPGVPLEKLIPTWIPAHLLISYLTGAILVIAGAAIVVAMKTRMAATYLGTWIFLIVAFIYGPILIAALLVPSTDVRVEGINYFFDTMLYVGTILALAKAARQSD
jgi:uncharacterized membrane protein